MKVLVRKALFWGFYLGNRLAAVFLISTCTLFAPPPLAQAGRHSTKWHPMPYDGGFSFDFQNDSLHHTLPGSYERISDVDFRSFFYNSESNRTVKLRNGKYSYQDGSEFEDIDLDSVYDLPSEDPDSHYALVLYTHSFGGDSNNYGIAQVFKLRDHRLTIIQEVEWNGHFMPAHREPYDSFSENSGTLIVRSAHALPLDANCCIAATDVTTLRWKRDHFIQTSMHSELSDFGLRVLRAYSRDMRKYPEDVRPVHDRGRAYEGAGEYDRAIQDFDRALRLNPKDDYAFYGRGIAYQGKANYEMAIADYSQALRLNPDNDEVYYNRGIAYYCKGDYDRAIQDFTENLRRGPKEYTDPNALDNLYNRGMAYYNKGDFGLAVRDFDSFIGAKSITMFEQEEGYNNRGIAYDSQGNYDRALQEFNYAAQSDSDLLKADVLYNQGIVFVHKGNYDHAIRDFSRALHLNPKLADAVYNRAIAYRHKSEYNRAGRDLTYVLRLNPQLAETVRGCVIGPQAKASSQAVSFSDGAFGCSLSLRPPHLSPIKAVLKYPYLNQPEWPF